MPAKVLEKLSSSQIRVKYMGSQTEEIVSSDSILTVPNQKTFQTLSDGIAALKAELARYEALTAIPERVMGFCTEDASDRLKLVSAYISEFTNEFISKNLKTAKSRVAEEVSQKILDEEIGKGARESRNGSEERSDCPFC